MRAAIELFRLMVAEFSDRIIPARMGSLINRLIREITQNLDPYKEIKARDNRRALQIVPYIRKAINSMSTEYERFREACKVSTL